MFRLPAARLLPDHRCGSDVGFPHPQLRRTVLQFPILRQRRTMFVIGQRPEQMLISPLHLGMSPDSTRCLSVRLGPDHQERKPA